MRKLIHSNWEIDLSNFKITDSVQNSVFSDSFFTVYTFPFDIDLTDDLDKAFGFISSYLTNPQTYYECQYFENNKIHPAKFEILETDNNTLQCQFEYGFENISTWDKKLAELSLHEFDLPTGVSIYEYAKADINKTYPAVDFCFPAIHIDLDRDDPLWENFEGLLNNFRNNNFIENTYDVPNEISLNKNIMQPFVFWLYLLKKGFEEAGFNLSGDVLNDSVLKTKAISSFVEYYKKAEPYELNIFKLYNEFDGTYPQGDTFGYFIDQTLVIEKKGRYNFIGTFFAIGSVIIKVEIYLNNNLIYQANMVTNVSQHDVDIEFDVFANSNLRIYYRYITNNQTNFDEETIVIDGAAFRIYEYNDQNEVMPEVRNENKINLKKTVPDITFGDFVKLTKNWRNYDLFFDGNNAIMNRIIADRNNENALDFSKFEIKNPLRKFNQGKSFILKFVDIEENPNYSYDQVFQDINGISQTDFIENSKTVKIEINALPLPLKTDKGFTTAHMFEQSNRVYAVAYEGLRNGKNETINPEEMLIPNTHAVCWFDWFVFRLNASAFKWNFKANDVDVLYLNEKSTLYAYGRFHLINILQRDEIEPGLFEIDVETEAMN